MNSPGKTHYERVAEAVTELRTELRELASAALEPVERLLEWLTRKLDK